MAEDERSKEGEYEEWGGPSERTFEGWQHPQCELPAEVLVAAALTQFHRAGEFNASPAETPGRDPYNPWRIGNNFRLGDG